MFHHVMVSRLHHGCPTEQGSSLTMMLLHAHAHSPHLKLHSMHAAVNPLRQPLQHLSGAERV